jgi:hypothetical protein
LSPGASGHATQQDSLGSRNRLRIAPMLEGAIKSEKVEVRGRVYQFAR